MEYKEPLIFMRWSAMHANMTGAAGGKKIYFLFSPLLFVGKRKVSVFDLYSISRIKRTNTRAQALLPGKQKKSRKCHGVDMYVIFSSPQKLKILGCKVSICSTFSLPRRQGGLL